MQDNIEQTTGNSIALLPPAERAVIVLDSTKTAAQLRELVEQSASIVEVLDPAGREQAHRAGMSLKNARTTISNTGKKAREDATAFSTAVIAEEKKLIAISEPEEKRVLALRDGYDMKVAAAKREQEAAEAARKARIQGMISAIRSLPISMTGASVAELADEIAELEAFKADDAFAEFAKDADAAAQATLEALRGLHSMKVAQEAEAARVASEKAELERLRAEQEKRDREAAEQRAEEARQREAEQARLDAERRQFEEERAEFQRQQAAAAAAQAQKDESANALQGLLPAEIVPAASVVDEVLPAEDRVHFDMSIEMPKNTTVDMAAGDDKTIVSIISADSEVITLVTPVVELSAPPTLKLGQISDRLGFTVTADFLLSLGFAHSATDKAAKLYHEREFAHICRALIRHIEGKIPQAEAA